MKIQIDTDEMKGAVTLDQIIELIFDNAAEGRKPSDFDFIKTNDSRIMDEIRKYTLEARKADLDKADAQSLEYMVEELATGLTDTFLLVNLDYFKQGMKFGAKLLMELTA